MIEKATRSDSVSSTFQFCLPFFQPYSNMKRPILFQIFLCYSLVEVLSNDESNGFCTADGECESSDTDRSKKYLEEDEESYRTCK